MNLLYCVKFYVENLRARHRIKQRVRTIKAQIQAERES